MWLGQVPTRSPRHSVAVLLLAAQEQRIRPDHPRNELSYARPVTIRGTWGLALRIVPIVLAVQLMAACASGVSGPAAITASPDGCAPTDQDRYVYRPARLQALRSCVRVTGTIVASSAEADGDVHINVRLDAPLEALLVTGNAFEDGALIVEPVCQFPPLQAEAIRICASDPDPLAGGLPRVGDHVWLEGRYVLDLQHHAWAELHPLYRWGPVAP